jgi:hypothetical protein
MSRTSFGRIYCSMPNVRTPVVFRPHTSDLSNMRQVFLNQEYGFEILPAPRRILGLGASCGYAALYFANKYENASIMCVEPSTSNFTVLTINTAHYHTIRHAARRYPRAGAGITLPIWQGQAHSSHQDGPQCTYQRLRPCAMDQTNDHMMPATSGREATGKTHFTFRTECPCAPLRTCSLVSAR